MRKTRGVAVNAAHASDSPENASREIGIVDVENDYAFVNLTRKYYP